MQSNKGYVEIVAVMQKFFDQAISGNWSYNPEKFDNNEVPVSVMAQDLLMTYKYGWKTSYYQNTYDAKKDVDEPAHSIGWVDETTDKLNNLLAEIDASDESECDACNV
jgi:ribonucleoside-diphosphate reductase alpha chain